MGPNFDAAADDDEDDRQCPSGQAKKKKPELINIVQNLSSMAVQRVKIS